MDGMAVLLNPVGADASANFAEKMAGKILYPNPGKHQKTGVVRQKGKIPFSTACIPSDKGIAILGFPCCRAEQHTGKYPAVPVMGYILDGLANTRVKPQVMIPMQPLLSGCLSEILL